MTDDVHTRTRHRRYRAVADKLARRIATGAYVAGKRLPSERELVEELGVSRPTLREALIALEIMGFVTVRGGSGIYVVDSGQEQPEVDLGIGTFELLEARQIVETDVAGIAARNISGEQLLELRHIIERQIKEVEHESARFDEEDKRFHVFIAEVSGNGALLHLVDELWKFRRESDIWRILDERTDANSQRARAVEDHISICAALETRDPKIASESMRQHIQRNIDWRLKDMMSMPTLSDKDRRTRVRLKVERELALKIKNGSKAE